MDYSLRPRARNDRQVLAGLTLSVSMLLPAAAQEAGLNARPPSLPYPDGLTPNTYYRVDDEVDPALGRLLTIEEFRATQKNFELCEPEGELIYVDLVNTSLDWVEENCSGDSIHHYDVPSLEEVWAGAIIVDAQYRPVGAVSDIVMEGPDFGVAFGVTLNEEVISEIYSGAEIDLLESEWSISPSQEQVFTVYGEDGQAQIIVPVSSAEALSQLLIPMRER